MRRERRFKRILHALLVPHTAVVIVLVPFSAAWLIYSFVFGESDHPATYGAYVLSAYALTVLCNRIPAILRTIERARNEDRYLVRWASDAALRVKVSLYTSLAINVAYAVFQLGLGFRHASLWFYALSVYYTALAVMRFFLLRYTRTHPAGAHLRAEWHRYRFCGVMLLAVNLALSVIVFYISVQGRTFNHHPITTIAMAAYTFTALTSAIVGLVKYRRYRSPVLSAAKAVSLASAAVSMLTLESAMLTAFGDGSDELFRRVMTSATGAAVCIFILLLSVRMTVHATKRLRKKEIYDGSAS